MSGNSTGKPWQTHISNHHVFATSSGILLGIVGVRRTRLPWEAYERKGEYTNALAECESTALSSGVRGIFAPL